MPDDPHDYEGNDYGCGDGDCLICGFSDEPDIWDRPSDELDDSEVDQDYMLDSEREVQKINMGFYDDDQD